MKDFDKLDFAELEEGKTYAFPMEEKDLLELLERYWHYLYLNGDVNYLWRKKFTLFGFMQWLKSRSK